MKVKVQCPCGSKFEFEVEPVRNRMPVQINCPTCNADATALANEVIQRQSEQVAPAIVPPPPKPAPIRVSSPEAPVPQASIAPAPPKTAAPGASGLRISHSTQQQHQPAPTAVPASTEAPGVKMCPRHKTEPAVESCVVCGKPLCSQCMEMFGYVCSVYCRQQAEAKRIEIPFYAHQKHLVAAKAGSRMLAMIYGVVLLVAAFFGVWIWYVWFARNPKIVYTLKFPEVDRSTGIRSNHPGFFHLIGPGQMLNTSNREITLIDLKTTQNLWSATLPEIKSPEYESEEAAFKLPRISRRAVKMHGMDNNNDPEGFDMVEEMIYNHGDFGVPEIFPTEKDVWVIRPHALDCFDRKTGSAKDPGIKEPIMTISPTDSEILVISGTRDGHRTLNRIALPEGTLLTEEIATAPAPYFPPKQTPGGKSAKNTAMSDKMPVGQLKALAEAAAQSGVNGSDEDSGMIGREQSAYVSAGETVVEFKAKMLEHKTISHEAMKAKGPSVLESGNVTASQGLDLAQEMMNDSRRAMTGGVDVEDVSRYAVTLHRHFAQGVPEWKGEVTGPPEFYPLKTVDILGAGQSLQAFDKQNKKLWDSKLTFAVSSHFPEDAAPCAETRDAIYFADLGMLTRFDTVTGNVRWRYNSVGISSIIADDSGGLYVSTTTAGPESITYSQQIDVRNKIYPVIVKLDAGSGKALWNLRNTGEKMFHSGKFLYTTSLTTAYAALHLEEGPDTHYYLNLIDPKNGGVIWTFHRGNRYVNKTEVQQKWILLHERDRIEVLKFFSL